MVIEIKGYYYWLTTSRGPESFQQCGRVRSSGDRFPPLWMIFDDLHLWSLLNCWRHMRANVASELVTEWDLCGQGHVVPNSDCQNDFKLRWRGAEHHREDTEAPEQSSRTLRIQHIDFSMFTLGVGILQTSLWRFVASGDAVVGTEVREDRPRFLLLKRSIWLSYGSDACGLDPWSWFPQVLASSTQPGQPWLRSCSTSVQTCVPAVGCWKVVEPTWIAIWTVAAFQCSVHAKLFQDFSEAACMDTARLKSSHGAHWVLVCFSHFVVILLVTCWHLSSSIFVHFWFSSGFLSNRLKLLPATPLMFANTLWQKHGRHLKAHSFSCPGYVY